MKKEGKDSENIPEDDPSKYKHAIYVMVMKVRTGALSLVERSKMHFPIR